MLIEMNDSKRLPELLAEKDSIDPSFTHALELLTKEINRITEGGDSKPNGNARGDGQQKLKDPDFINAFTDKRPKVECHLKIPVEEFPGVNFVGKILGPGGSTLKQVQEQTNTGIAILGKGSQRDEKKAQELLESGDTKWAHLRHPLHVQLRAIGPVDQCYMRISHACTELLKLMQVTDDMITDRGKFGGPMRGGRGRGGQRGGRGMGGMRGGRGMRGRGGPPGRGGRGMGRGGPGGRGGAPNKRGRGGGFNNKSFGGDGGDDYYTDYPQQPESGYEGYNNQDGGYGDESYGGEGGYDESYGAGDGGYGDGSYGYEGYGGGYGNGGAGDGGYGSGASGAAATKPFRGKAAGGGRGRGRGNRATPY